MRLLRSVSSAVTFVVTALTIFAVATGYGIVRFGSISAAIEFAQGESVLVDERTKTINGIHSGSEVTVTYYITNNSGRPLNLIGAAPSCTCTAVESMPLAFLPSETKAVTAKIKVSDSSPTSSGHMRLFTDAPGLPEIMLNYVIVGAITATEEQIHSGS